MKNLILFLIVILTFSIAPANAQTVPTVEEVKTFINDNHFLITSREGEVLYGTYFFIEVHYCPDGKYGLYGKSIKRTVMGNEQHNNWQEFGTWKVINHNGVTGIFYKTTALQEKFFPVYRLANGDFWMGEGITIVKKGKAICK